MSVHKNQLSVPHIAQSTKRLLERLKGGCYPATGGQNKLRNFIRPFLEGPCTPAYILWRAVRSICVHRDSILRFGRVESWGCIVTLESVPKTILRHSEHLLSHGLWVVVKAVGP